MSSFSWNKRIQRQRKDRGFSTQEDFVTAFETANPDPRVNLAKSTYQKIEAGTKGTDISPELFTAIGKVLKFSDIEIRELREEEKSFKKGYFDSGLKKYIGQYVEVRYSAEIDEIDEPDGSKRKNEGVKDHFSLVFTEIKRGENYEIVTERVSGQHSYHGSIDKEDNLIYIQMVEEKGKERVFIILTCDQVLKNMLKGISLALTPNSRPLARRVVFLKLGKELEPADINKLIKRIENQERIHKDKLDTFISSLQVDRASSAAKNAKLFLDLKPANSNPGIIWTSKDFN